MFEGAYLYPLRLSSPTNQIRILGLRPTEEEPEKEPPVAAHARRASATIANRLNQTPSAFATEAHAERATNLLRRLSLGAPALAKVNHTCYRNELN